MRARGRINHQPGVMNNLEIRYSVELEQRRALTKELFCWRFEPLKFRLADKTFYTPDFMVQDMAGFIEFREVKGYWEEDARVKIKVAAEMFPMFSFVGITWDKQIGWVREEFS